LAARRPRPRRSDPVRLEVFHHLFAAAAEEMGATLMRSSFSTNIRERRDFSCALFDDKARMIAQAAHLPVHLGSTPLCVAAAIDAVRMEPGDAVILNDPFAGGTHLPDITLVSPVFLRGSRRPDFYCANRAHHADVGGARPGSMAPVADVHGEGLRIPPLRLVAGGRIERPTLRLILANVRVPREREGDLLAQWSANRVGARRLEEMAEEHGAAALRRHAAGLMGWTESLTRAFLGGLPDAHAAFEDELESPVAGGARNARLVVALDKRGDTLAVDLSGTDPQVAGPINTTRAVALSAVFYVLRLFLPDEAPSNDGVLRPVSVRTEPGTIVDARYPAAVAAGNVETSQRLVDVLLGAFAEFLPERIPAASAGTMSNLTLGGAEGTAAERTFAYYETLPGGAGGGPDGPGASALQTHMTNTRNTPIEELERDLPVRVQKCTVRRGSGGAGRHRGGDGIEKRLRFLAPVSVGWIAERQTRGPWGRAGGRAGAPGRAAYRLPGEAQEHELAGKQALDLPAGAELELWTPGGGGWGPRPDGPRL
jgi:N-methylhydantoinase B